eukprot:gene19552-26234_t
MDIACIHQYVTDQGLSETARNHMIAPLRIAKQHFGHDVVSALHHVDDLMAAVKKEYNNPRTSRNYINGLKMVVHIPAIRQAVGEDRSVDIEKKLHNELQSLNHASYQMSRRPTNTENSQQELERLRKENDILRKMLQAINSLTAGIA